jgi:hypothetical protein
MLQALNTWEIQTPNLHQGIYRVLDIFMYMKHYIVYMKFTTTSHTILSTSECPQIQLDVLQVLYRYVPQQVSQIHKFNGTTTGLPPTDEKLRGNVDLQRHKRRSRPHVAGVAHWP